MLHQPARHHLLPRQLHLHLLLPRHHWYQGWCCRHVPLQRQWALLAQRLLRLLNQRLLLLPLQWGWWQGMQRPRPHLLPTPAAAAAAGEAPP
jgi:hypothetical protein